SESLATVTYRIRNQGPSGTGAGTSFVQRLYLSTDAVVGNDKFLSQYIWPAELPAGEFFDVVHSFYLPRSTGQFWLVVKTDEDGVIGELLENNNAAVSAPIQVNAAYAATVSTDVETALAGTPVPLRGRAYKPDGTGVPYALVNLHVSVRGTTRVFSALCDAEGNYTTTFTPLAGEAGNYGVGADHPGVSSTGVQDTFKLLGMASEPKQPSLQVVEGESAETTATLRNLSDVALNGLTLEVSDNLPNVEFSAELDDTFLAGLGTRTLTLRATAADASFVGGGGTVTVRSVEGAELLVPVRIGVTDLRPKLVATPGRLVAGMKRGSQVTVELGLKNEGGEATGALEVQLPPLAWLSATVGQIGSLAPGESTSLMLVLTPPEDLPLGPYTGSIGFGNTTYGISVPFEFRSISEAKGDLRVVAVDEYTYYAEGSPKVAGASVQVRDAYNNALVASGTTDENGVAQFLQLPEGYYSVRVSADKHSTYSEVHFLNPGTVTYV
ncbi:MAG: hypothetical protein H7A47_18440, partial [Verrucomicrobiales bacterium]|nr:hypothetical protein [Verrucomicrobiales bacterium]